MHDDAIDPRLHDGVDECVERLAWILVIDADAALDRHRHVHRSFERRDAAPDEFGFPHQAGAEPPILHPI